MPYGATTEGFGGTYATQENFRLMREAMDKVGEELGRYIRVCNYCSGLCMPEIAAMGAFEGLDVMLNDALYGILFRDINMQRTLVDQSFSRAINAYAGVVINTGEDNYLTTADAVDCARRALRDGGRFLLCQRPEQLAEILAALRAARLEPKRLAFVKNRPDAAPWLFLVEAQKGRKTGLRVEPDILIQSGAALYGPNTL